MQKAFFSGIRNELITLLRDAKHTVDIAMAWFTSSELFNELLECLSRGVRVRLVLLDDPINFMEYAPNFNSFIKGGGFLYIATSKVGFMHHKFCIVDDKIIISGSYNWTYYAETRNVENIFVTDDVSVIYDYQVEFQRLLGHLIEAKNVSRLSFDELSIIRDVDFRQINYELENICQVRNLPVRKIFETHSQVVISEIKKKPVVKYDIGILAADENGILHPDIFLSAGTPLPCKSEKRVLYIDAQKNFVCPCKVVKVIPSNKYGALIVEEDLAKVVNGRIDNDLKIEFMISLEDNGSLRVDVLCESTGLHMKVSSLDKDLVKYE